MIETAMELMPFSYPLAARSEESKIDIFKQRQIIVDGYDLVLHFSCEDHVICRMECLELAGVYMPFLPMWLVCKVGAAFLGSHELKYGESFKGGRKIYVWTIAVDEDGKPVELTNPLLNICNYEDFKFSFLPQELL